MKIRLIKISLALATGILFTLLTVFKRDGAEIESDQAFILRICRGMKKTESQKEDYVKKNFLLINTITDQNFGNETSFTNREQLLTLIRILSKNQDSFKYIILDVMLDNPSSNKGLDDSLSFYIDQLQERKKIVFSGVWNEKDDNFLKQIYKPAKSSMGDIGYERSDGRFFQYKLCPHDTTIKSLPFLLYLKNEGAQIVSNTYGIVKTRNSTGKSSFFFNTFTPELFFGHGDFEEIYKNYNDNEYINDSTIYCNLSSIIGNPENENLKDANLDSVRRIQELLSIQKEPKKIIFIGDFSSDENDSHFTTEGKMKGPEIIINILYNLLNGNGRLSQSHLIFLLISYCLLSILLYMPIHIKKPETTKKMLAAAIVAFDIIVVEHLSYIALLLISIISYLVYNHIVNVLTLTLYVFIISSVVKALEKLDRYP